MGDTIDRDKLIQRLEDSVKFFKNRVNGVKFAAWMGATRDAIKSLKAQEPMKPKWEKGYAYCGKCGYNLHWIVDLNNFCPNCGQAVKWE